jgi:hypothetical protein
MPQSEGGRSLVFEAVLCSNFHGIRFQECVATDNILLDLSMLIIIITLTLLAHSGLLPSETWIAGSNLRGARVSFRVFSCRVV